MSFITLSKEQFEAILPERFLVEDIPRVNEVVYSIPTDNSDVAVRIYSTVDKSTGQTRDKGQDAKNL